MRISLPLLAATLASVALLAPITPSVAYAGAAEEEAMRQLQLAQEDLKSGKVDRAIAAATSARRLDPTLIDALLINALALEVKEEFSTARALVLAYKGAAAEVDPTADALLDRLDRAEPVRASVQRRDDGTVVVTFAARDFLEDPTLHWRDRGAWRSTWMDQNERGEWVATVEVSHPRRGLEWWVEQTLGAPLLEELGEGEGRPFRLALK